MKNLAIFIDFKGVELSSYSNSLLVFADEFFGSDVNYYLFSTNSPSQASIPNLKGSIKAFQINAKHSLYAAPVELAGLGNIIAEQKIDEIWLSKSNTSDSIGSFISSSLEFQIVPNIKQIAKQGDHYVIQKSIFSGKAIANLEVKNTQFVGIFPKGFGSDSGSNLAVKAINFESLDLESNNSYTIEKMETHDGMIPLPEAAIVVGAGRGMKDPGNWGIIEELANALRAATACSKPVSDINWRPHHEHVGQTGIKIAPKLYIACGISGAIQHLAGVNGSGKIVVINTDPEAPFFKHADYGIVGDLFDVVPRLTKIIKEM
jgi:electron transfer flavoprotein alpha subunit